MQRFSHLVNGTSSIQNTYTKAELATKLVIRDEAVQDFILLERSNWYEWYSEQESPRMHEVIFGDRPQRLKFDVDMMADQLANITGTDLDVLEQIIYTIIDVFQSQYYISDGVFLTPSDIFVYESSGTVNLQEQKYSFHIVLDATVANNYEGAHFTTLVLNNLPPLIQAVVDSRVNKTLQNFRLPYSIKVDQYGGARKKIPSTRARDRLGTRVAEPKDFLVWSLENPLSPKIQQIEAPITPISTECPADIAQLVAEKYPGIHTYYKSCGNLHLFRREQESYCELCDRVHSRDNTLMVVRLDGAILEKCRKSSNYVILKKNSTSLSVAELINQLETALPLNELDYTGKIYAYEQATMREYDLVDTLFVKSQMKMGKTKSLLTYLNTHFNQVIGGQQRVIFITFRKTFSQNLKEIFPDFTLYTALTGPIYQAMHPRLVIQVESLHRIVLDYGTPTDLVILDESESILEQFSSGLLKKFNSAFAIFSYLLQSAAHVICMDANMSNQTYLTVTRLRPNPDQLLHLNTYLNATEESYLFTFDENQWVGHLYEALLNSKKIVVVLNSLKEAEKTYVATTALFPTKKIKIYSSKSTPQEREDLNYVNEKWSQLDVLIYTPTISAGVSYEIEHFDILFGYFVNQSCTVETCRQMMGRIRSIKNHIICLKSFPMFLPTETAKIEEYICSQRALLFDPPQIPATITSTGRVEYFKTPYYYLWLETERIRNLSKNNFAKRFIRQVLATGAMCGALPATTTNMASEFIRYGENAKAQKHAMIAAAADLTEPDAINLAEKLKAEDITITRQNLYELEKYWLRVTYEWEYTIDDQFVATYSQPEVKKIWMCLKQIVRNVSCARALQTLQAQERGKFLTFGNNWTYTYHKHLIALTVLELCGFINMVDPNEVLLTTFQDQLETAVRPYLKKKQKTLAYEFRIQSYKNVLKAINLILNQMYGIQLIKVMASVRIEPTTQNHYFTFYQTNNKKPFLNCQLKRIPYIPEKIFLEGLEQNIKEDLLV